MNLTIDDFSIDMLC